MKWGRRFKREGTYVHLWLIHADVWQTPTQYCKAIILQLKLQKKPVCLWLLITVLSQEPINQVNITFSSEELGEENGQESSVN